MFLENNAITSGSYASVLAARDAFPRFQARTTSSILRKYSLPIPSYHFDTGQMKNLQKSKNNFKTAIHTGVAASAIIAVVLIAGCSTQLISHGNMPEKKIVDSIRVGINNRAQVLAILGSPSVRATFDQETWLYVGTKTLKTLSFLSDEILERQVLAIRFNKQGIVQRIERFDKNDGQEIKVVKRKTPTRGKELTVIEQLLGNVGRFDDSSTGGNFTGP